MQQPLSKYKIRASWYVSELVDCFSDNEALIWIEVHLMIEVFKLE